MPGRDRPGLGELVQPGAEGAQGEDGDAHETVRAVPVPAGDPVHEPGEPLGQEPERPGDGRVGVVDVRQHAGPGGQHHARGQVRLAHVQQRRQARESDRTAQCVIPAHHRRCAPG